jgi:lipoyl(octanoyl) transferase
LQLSSSKNNDPLVEHLGLLSYTDSRNYIRNELHPFIKGTARVSILFAEHPPTLTLGKRLSLGEVSTELRELCEERKIEILETDRGGQMTYHGPGQLMIYPALDLRAFGLTVRSFVHSVLSSVSEVCNTNGLKTWVDDRLQGVWVSDCQSLHQRKIVSAGFRIINGISDHGVSIYISEINKEFAYFSPCGGSSDDLTSFSVELGESFNSASIQSSFLSLFPKYFLSRINGSKIQGIVKL